MGDNRGEAYLQNPLSKTGILLRLLPNGVVIIHVKFLIYKKSRHRFTVNFSATFHCCRPVHVSTLVG